MEAAVFTAWLPWFTQAVSMLPMPTHAVHSQSHCWHVCWAEEEHQQSFRWEARRQLCGFEMRSFCHHPRRAHVFGEQLSSSESFCSLCYKTDSCCAWHQSMSKQANGVASTSQKAQEAMLIFSLTPATTVSVSGRTISELLLLTRHLSEEPVHGHNTSKSRPAWVLETEFWSSARAVSCHNHWAIISPDS